MIVKVGVTILSFQFFFVPLQQVLKIELKYEEIIFTIRVGCSSPIFL